MGLYLVAVGRLRAGTIAALFDDYASRLRPRLKVVEVEERLKLPAAERIAREGEKLRAAIPKGALVVALDGGGRALTSEEFAVRLGDWRDQGRDVAFVIGGADGLDPGLRAAAAFTLSLGPMTWPHLLVRAMLAEQLWRAQSIRTGHPYHRG